MVNLISKRTTGFDMAPKYTAPLLRGSGELRQFEAIILISSIFAQSGYNKYGQLGRGITSEGLRWACVINGYARFLDEAPELVKIIQVSCGEDHSAAMSEECEMLFVQVSCGGVHVVALLEDGLLPAWAILGDLEAWANLGIVHFNPVTRNCCLGV
ncbi:unnamed protein product [Fraxinus pennsylvanica]|uniref:Uncharacterized protein n=1 Tax=Fraxinus pennsylvanica TaxID=56036 RepID=A0AAD2AG64_9LAMI|nr:unnamed protein product [Fraxinus pennsylvanica]